MNAVGFDQATRTLVSGSHDKTIRVWDVATGSLLHTFKGHEDSVNSVTFDRTGTFIASGSADNSIKLWDAATGSLLRTLNGHKAAVNGVAFDPAGVIIASASSDGSVRFWEAATGLALRTSDNYAVVLGIAFDPTGVTLASSCEDRTVKLLKVENGRLMRTLEGHTGSVNNVAFSADGRLIASKSSDHTIRLWRTDTFEPIAVIPEPTNQSRWNPSIEFHPSSPHIAVVGSDQSTSELRRDRIIHIFKLDMTRMLEQPTMIPTSHYVNAKVVLLGDTGVGKSGLSLVLNGKDFEPTDSTPGRQVWTFNSEEVQLSEQRKQTRETLLWDLAGQPGYRVIHQLHLNEVAVALVVFDARSETDPLAGVRHWERALRLAQQRQGSSSVPMTKLLVSARNDRGTVSVSKERLEEVLREFEFAAYFETSAKEGWKIKDLRSAIEQAISWEALPEVSSSVLFADIKGFLLEMKKTGRLIAPAVELYDDFVRARSEKVKRESNLSDQFETCIGRLENRDLIRRLSFGGYVLLQPELLDAYASAMVNAAKEEPDGLGSIAEDVALAGLFYVPREQKVEERGQEQLLLHATVEELARYELALRESAADGRYLVFPSQFNRDYEDAPEPKGKALSITFEGPVQSLYSTLAVRLGHSGLFSTGRAEMWRNAAIFTARAGGRCGIYLHEFAEARGRLLIFYDQHDGRLPSDETRFHFEEFVVAHTKRRALDGSVESVRFFVCVNGHAVPDDYVKLLRDQGKNAFDCPCGASVMLSKPEELLRFSSKVATMERTADRQRDFEMFVESARGETSTPNFTEWAGADLLTLAIVFTDVVGSTAIGEEIRDEAMGEVRRAHFAQSRKLIDQFRGREIKTIGDSFMAAFKSVDAALDYAVAFQRRPGHRQVQIRVGMHIGPMHVEEGDVFGGTVNFAARVIGAIEGSEIWLSDRAKDDIDRLGAAEHKRLKWQRHDDVPMKGFPGQFTLWSLTI